MTDPLFDGEDEANTPLEEEEREQLIPPYISTRAELNEAEQVNITHASLWLRRARNVDVLDDAFLRHRLVSIHPFPNGNGRMSRLVGDLLVMHLGQLRFTWGRTNLVDAGATRHAYVAALQAADRGDIEPLLAFARS
jgi:fido (protein-threonine AMPylation protein)